MIKQKLFRFTKNKTVKIVVAIVLVGVLVIAGLPQIKLIHALTIQEQITALEQANANNQSVVARLRDQATSYQDAINKLQAQINTLQAQIDANTKEQERLQNEITVAEAELAKQKHLLGENIKAMYLEGQISTLEMLASSKDLSEFVDKEQYHNSVKDKISATLDKIIALKLQL